MIKLKLPALENFFQPLILMKWKQVSLISEIKYLHQLSNASGSLNNGAMV